MNRQPSSERGWSRARWLTVVGLLFGLQAVCAWRLSDRSPSVVRHETRKLAVRLVPPTISPDLAALLQLNSPTLFVLPSREGFSGRAWLDVRPLEFRSAGWSNPPQWLALEPEELLVDFERFGATNQPERAAVSDRLSRPQPSRMPLGPEFQIQNATRITITGDVTLRELVTSLELPVFEHPGLLAPTVISALVDQRGRVFQVSLAPGGSSGSVPADQLAMERVRGLKFVVDPRISPSRDARDFELLRRTRITVHWSTKLSAPATNAPVATPALQPLPL